MRFRFLKPRKDVASAEQVRALRERRGWTVEQLADEVHAPALEVSAWEAGTVAVPPKQALLIHWMTDVDAWRAALDESRGRSCAWVREHGPDLYERMFRGTRGVADGADEHVPGCAACTAALERARRMGGYPARPDTSGSLGARYWHWVDRLPRWAQGPFAVAGAAVGITLPLAFFALLAPEMWLASLLGLMVFALTTEAAARVRSVPGAGFLPVLAGISAGLLGWSLFPGNDLTGPLPWLVAAGFAGVAVVSDLRSAMARRRKARGLAAGASPAPALPSPSPELPAAVQRGELEAIRTLADAPRAEPVASAGGADVLRSARPVR